MLEYLSATATCARIASTTMDYMSRGRLRDWLFGIESHSLGEAWPDVLGVTIVVVTTALFMMGLEVRISCLFTTIEGLTFIFFKKSVALAIMLYIGLIGSLMFFVIVGSFHTDTKFWSWAEDFNLRNWKHVSLVWIAARKVMCEVLDIDSCGDVFLRFPDHVGNTGKTKTVP